MNSFLGYLPGGVGCKWPLGLVNLTTGLPAAPDDNPIYRIFGQSGLVVPGDGTVLPVESGSLTDATNASPIVVTFNAATQLITGTAIFISGVLTNTNANGLHVVTVLTDTTAELDANGNGAYGGGGTWYTAGLYLLDLSFATVPSIVGVLEESMNYTVQVSWAESGDPMVNTFGFSVV